MAVDTAGDPTPFAARPRATQRRRTEWWLLAPLALALLAIFQLTIGQRGRRDTPVVLDTNPPGEPADGGSHRSTGPDAQHSL